MWLLSRRLLHHRCNPVPAPESCPFWPCVPGICSRCRCFLPETLQTDPACEREQWFASFSEVFFTRVQQTVDPWQQFLGMVGVNNRGYRSFSNCVNVFSTRDSTDDSSFLTFQFHAFTSDECSTAVRELNDNRSFNLAAASRTALMESVPTQLTAGRANLFALATSNTFCTSSPVITPGLTKSKILDISKVLSGLFNVYKIRAERVAKNYLLPTQKTGVSPPLNHYPLARSSRIATAGRTLPSTNSRNAPPPVEM